MYEIAEQHGTIEKNFEKMNLLDVVYIPNGLSKKKLVYFQQRFMRQFYLRPVIFIDYLKRLIINPSNLLI